MQPLGGAAVRKILDDARRQASGDADGLRDPGRREAESRRDADGCSRRAEDRGRMKTRFVRSLRRDEAHATHDLDAGGDAFDHGVAGEAAMLGGRENGRNDDRSGMDWPAFEGVVVVLAVSGRTVDESRVVRTEAAVVPDRRRVAGRGGARPHGGRRSRSCVRPRTIRRRRRSAAQWLRVPPPARPWQSSRRQRFQYPRQESRHILLPCPFRPAPFADERARRDDDRENEERDGDAVFQEDRVVAARQ